MRVTDTSGNDHIRYTRAGNFTITRDGYITDADGNHLQSEAGDLIVPTDAEIVIDRDGAVYANGELIDQIIITDFEDYNYLEHYGENLFQTVEGAEEKDAEGAYIGRTQYDAPEIDNSVIFTSDRELVPGDFVKVQINDAFDYDLTGMEV